MRLLPHACMQGELRLTALSRPRQLILVCTPHPAKKKEWNSWGNGAVNSTCQNKRTHYPPDVAKGNEPMKPSCRSKHMPFYATKKLAWPGFGPKWNCPRSSSTTKIFHTCSEALVVSMAKRLQ